MEGLYLLHCLTIWFTFHSTKPHLRYVGGDGVEDVDENKEYSYQKCHPVIKNLVFIGQL